MPLFKNRQKKQSAPAPEEPKKGVRQQLAEQESGCEIRHVADPKPEAGKVYQAEYWEIANIAGESFRAAADAYDKIRYDDPRKAAEIAAGLDACTFERDRIDKAHPRLSAALPEIAAVRYDSLDDALCALEKATYGFDLSGREPEREPDLTWTHDLGLNAARAIGRIAADPGAKKKGAKKPAPKEGGSGSDWLDVVLGDFREGLADPAIVIERVRTDRGPEWRAHSNPRIIPEGGAADGIDEKSLIRVLLASAEERNPS